MTTLAQFKMLVNTTIKNSRSSYLPSRYPYTYAADFLRSHWDLVPEDIRDGLDSGSRGDASYARQQMASAWAVEDDALAIVLANGYLIENNVHGYEHDPRVKI